MQLDDRAAGAAGPGRRFPFVALEHADIVQRWAPARPEERRPVGVTGRSSHSRCTTNGGAVPQRCDPGPPVVVAEGGRAVDDALQPGHVGGQHHAVAFEVGAGIAVHPKASGRCVTAVTETPVWNRAPRDSRYSRSGFHSATSKLAFGDVEDQALAGAEEVDVEHGGQLGGRQLGGLGEEAAGEHLERQMPGGVGKVDVAQEGLGVEVVEPLVDVGHRDGRQRRGGAGVEPDQVAQPERRAAQCERQRVQRRRLRQAAEGVAPALRVDQRVVLDRR